MGLKAKPTKPVTEVLRPVVAKYGLQLNELVARLVSVLWGERGYAPCTDKQAHRGLLASDALQMGACGTRGHAEALWGRASLEGSPVVCLYLDHSQQALGDS